MCSMMSYYYIFVCHICCFKQKTAYEMRISDGSSDVCSSDLTRFRGNILLDGAEPWAEFGWLGRRLRIGNAELVVEQRIGRCAATNVDPETGQRDMTVPRDLLRGFGHGDCGVSARVTVGGTIVAGDDVDLHD